MEEITILLWIIIKILCIVLPLMGVAAYLTFAERKVIGHMQARMGPNRAGPLGLLQPLADAVKLLFKEIILPTAANRYLFLLSPILVVVPALAAWAVVPFSQGLVLANINAGVLYLLAMTSLGVYGVMIAGWSSNSKYAFYGSMRSAAQVISYEIAMGFALAGVLLAADSMNLSQIVLRQAGGASHWFVIPLLPLFFVYWVSAVAETNRAPFDVAEGESEIVAGFHVEYAGMGFALFFLGEYINMILVSTLAVLLFFGGWLSPFQGIPQIEQWLTWVPGLVWLSAKVSIFLWLYLWLRATFPRYRYDQIMRLGWKVLIPLSLLWIIVVALLVHYHIGIWFAG